MASETSAPARAAWAAIGELFNSPQNHERFHRACASIEVSPPGLKALLSLDADEPKPMRVLAEEWRCDASWVTSLVDMLEERGMVERRIQPADRRVKTIVLTDVGAKAKATALENLWNPPLPGLAALTLAEQVQLRDLLRRVVDATLADPHPS